MERELGKRIAELRRQKGLTQRQLGDLMSVSDKTVSKWENGGSLPDVASLGKLAEIFECTVDHLMTGNPPELTESAPNAKSHRRLWIAAAISGGVLLIAAFVVLIVLYFVTVVPNIKGVYINVDNSNDYYIVNNTTYNHYYVAEDGTVRKETGSWFAPGGKLSLAGVELSAASGQTSHNASSSFVRLGDENTINESIDLTFVDGGSTNVVTVKRGSAITPPTPADREGCVFVGWSVLDEDDNVVSWWQNGDLIWTPAVYVAQYSCVHAWDNDLRCVDATCMRCGEIRPATQSHVYADDHTCHDRTCLRCATVCPATTEHTYADLVKAQPTCTETGEMQSVCTGCGIVVNTILPAKGHTESEWILDLPATCRAAGQRHTQCIRCHMIISQEVLPVADHLWVTDPVVEPTCTEEGLSQGEHCEWCGKVSVAQTAISALGHQWGQWHTTLPATCTSEGTEERICARCGAHESADLSMIDHSWSGWGEYSPSTCTVAGQNVRTCSGCGYQQYETASLKPHDWGEWETISPAGCSQEGERRHTCSRCGREESEVVPTTPHTVVVLQGYEATCMADGLTDGEMCTVCGTILVPQEEYTVDCCYEDGECIWCGRLLTFNLYFFNGNGYTALRCDKHTDYDDIEAWAPALPIPEQYAKGYTAGWGQYDLDNYVDQYVDPVYAIITYTITLHPTEGTLPDGQDRLEYDVLTPTFDLPTPTREGYVFAGWYTDEETPRKLERFEQGGTGDLDLYAEWSEA